MAKIRFTVKRGGEVNVEVECAMGAACDALTLPYEQALGTPLGKHYKPEYFDEGIHAEVEQYEGS